MDSELKRFLEKIMLTDYDENEFLDATIDKVVINRSNDSFKVYLNFKNLVSFELLEKLAK